ncbi:MAG: aminopeptidase P family protein [Thermotogaceae bacterium]|nr:aminopeptidase P family protein [Thermotogaceae bacterium]
MNYKERRERLLEESEAEAVLLVNIEGSSKPSIIYYTGFSGTFAALLLTKDEEIFITDPRYTEQAKKQTGMKVLEFRGNKFFHEFLADIINDKRLKKIAIEKERISVDFFEKLSEKLGNVEFGKVDGIIKKHRMVKDETEVKKLKKAIQIAEKAFLDMLDFIKEGKTEKEIAAYLEYRMKVYGAERAGFETILASGPRSALPHGIASDKVIEDGDIIVVDFGCVYEGYHSDLTRMVAIGEPGHEVRKVHDIVFNAQIKAIKEAKPGMTGKEIDAIARTYIESKGYKKEFGHGLGHGVGLEIHESPRISPMGKEEIVKGVVFTIEPGIYLEGQFGIRIEDDVIMRKDGVEVLSTLDRKIYMV